MTPLKITDALKTPDMANDGKTMMLSISPEYPTVTPWSLDDKWLILAGRSHCLLHDGQTGKFLRPLKASNANEWIGASVNQPRWSRTDAQVFYFLSGNSLKFMDVVTMTSSVLRTFAEYSKIDGMGEGDMLSDDGSLMVLCGDNREVFTLNMATLGGPVSILPGVESLYLTPRNNVLVSYYSNGSARYQGVELFDKNMKFVRQILDYNTHKDVALNAGGDEILIHGNGAAAIVATNISANLTWQPPSVTIFKSHSGLAEHISCPIGKDFFFVDRYDPTNAIPGDILKIWLDGRSEVLCLHGSKAFPPENKYTYQPKVSCNREGDKLVFGSNYGIGSPVNYSDTYMLKLAAEVKPVSVNPNLPIRFNWDKHKAMIDKDGITIL